MVLNETPTNSESTSNAFNHTPNIGINSHTLLLKISNNSNNLNIGNANKSNVANLTSSISNSNNISGRNQSPWPEVNNMSDLLTLGCSTAVIFGGLVPYIPQYLKIHRTLNSDGFSTYVCLTLLLANIMRIMFWFGHKFETPLLLQSFVMIAGMLAMVEICVRVKDKDPIYGKPRRFFIFGKTVSSSESTPIYSVPSSNSFPSVTSGHQRLPTSRRSSPIDTTTVCLSQQSYNSYKFRDESTLNVRYSKQTPSYKCEL